MDFAFLCNMNYPIVKISCSQKLMFLLTTLKDLVNLRLRGKCKTELKNVFFYNFSIVTTWYMPVLVALMIPWNRIQNQSLCSLRLISAFFQVNLWVLWVYAPSGHNTRKQLTRVNFFEGQQQYIKTKVNKMSGGSKHKDFVDAILIVPCQNSW